GFIIKKSSIGGENGIAGTSGPANLAIGASKSNKQCSAIIADTSLITLPSRLSSVTSNTLPVFLAQLIIVSLSNGYKVRKSTTSTSISSVDRISAACNA